MVVGNGQTEEKRGDEGTGQKDEQEFHDFPGTQAKVSPGFAGAYGVPHLIGQIGAEEISHTAEDDDM